MYEINEYYENIQCDEITEEWFLMATNTDEYEEF